MSRATSHRAGQFCWVDLLTPDASAAKKFYSELFGWSVLENPTDQGGTYTMFQQDGLDVAGMGEMGAEMKSSGMPAVWNSYVAVDDADAVAARVAELGGKVEMPVMQVMTAGRMAIFSDPVGAHFSVWEKGEHFGASLVNEPNSLGWNELGTREPEKAKDFYAALFGWEYKDAGGDYFEILIGGRSGGGIRRSAPPEPEMAFWMPYLSVADCDATLESVQSLGGNVLTGPVDIEPGRFCVVTDSQGACFTVMKIHHPE